MRLADVYHSGVELVEEGSSVDVKVDLMFPRGAGKILIDLRVIFKEYEAWVIGWLSFWSSTDVRDLMGIIEDAVSNNRLWLIAYITMVSTIRSARAKERLIRPVLDGSLYDTELGHDYAKELLRVYRRSIAARGGVARFEAVDLPRFVAEFFDLTDFYNKLYRKYIADHIEGSL